MTTRTVLLLGLLAMHCGTPAPRENAQRLDRDQALALAVELANTECREHFGVSPFDSGSFTIELAEGRWRWGALDVHGVDGYSAEASFDLKGNDGSVQVYLSTDKRHTDKRLKKQLDTRRRR